MVHNIPRSTGLRQERSKFSGEKRGGGNYTDKRVRIAPFVRGQTIEVTITAIGHNGDGLAYEDGFTVFVPNSSLGEKLKAKVFRVQHTVVFTQRVDKARLSPGRGEQKRVSRVGRMKRG